MNDCLISGANECLLTALDGTAQDGQIDGDRPVQQKVVFCLLSGKVGSSSKFPCARADRLDLM